MIESAGAEAGAVRKGQSWAFVGGDADSERERAVGVAGGSVHRRGARRERVLREGLVGEHRGHEDHRGPQKGDRPHNDAQRQKGLLSRPRPRPGPGRGHRLGQDQLLLRQLAREVLGLKTQTPTPMCFCFVGSVLFATVQKNRT